MLQGEIRILLSSVLGLLCHGAPEQCAAGGVAEVV